MCLSFLDVVEGTGWFQCEYFIFIFIQKEGKKAPYFRLNIKHRTTTKETNICSASMAETKNPFKIDLIKQT